MSFIVPTLTSLETAAGKDRVIFSQGMREIALSVSSSVETGSWSDSLQVRKSQTINQTTLIIGEATMSRFTASGVNMRSFDMSDENRLRVVVLRVRENTTGHREFCIGDSAFTGNWQEMIYALNRRHLDSMRSCYS